MPRIRLNAAQVLARMRRGEVLTMLDYGAASFPDDARPGAGVLMKLVKAGKIERPTPHIGNAYILPPRATEQPKD